MNFPNTKRAHFLILTFISALATTLLLSVASGNDPNLETEADQSFFDQLVEQARSQGGIARGMEGDDGC